MPLTLHLFKKDLRRSYLLLAFWALLIAGQYAVMAASLRPGDHLAQMTYAAISNIGPLLESLVLAVLVALLVQEESPAGTTGFWLTRPMSRVAVLQTKAIFAVILLALPVLAEIIVFRAGGVTRHDIALAVPEIILTQLQVMLGAAVLAALTTNFARFAIAGAVCGVAIYLADFVADWLPEYLGHDNSGAFRIAATVLKSRTIAQDVLIAAGLGSVFFYQYATRRTARALGLGIAVELAALVVGNVWTWDFFSPLPEAPATIPLDLPAIKMKLQYSQSMDLSGGYRGSGPTKKSVSGELSVTGLPAGSAALPKRVLPRLTEPGGGAIPALEPLYSNYGFSPNSDMFECAMGKVFVYGVPYYSDETASPLVTVTRDTFQKHAQQRLILSDDIDFDVARFVVTARMPVAKGAQTNHGSEHEFITDVLREGSAINIIFQLRYVNLLFQRPGEGRQNNRYLVYLSYSPESRTYVLLNRRTREVIRPQMSNGISRLDNRMPNGRLVQETWRLSFGPDNWTLTPNPNAAWLADAELVELELKPGAAFTQKLTVDNFTLEGPNRPATPEPQGPPTNPEWLTRFVLPEHATKGQMKEYVDALVVATQYWRRPDARLELPTTLLTKVGAGNADVLLGDLDLARPANEDRLLVLATIRASGPEDKAAVLGALKANPDLADVVVKFKWQNDCRDTLLAGLRDEKNTSLPRDWIVAAAALDDPATYPDLKAYLVRAHNRQTTYNSIRKLPGIDLGDTIAAAWKQAQAGTRAEVIDAAAMAIDVGYPDALGALIGVLREDDVGQPQQLSRTLTLVKRYTRATGNADAVLAWYDANKDRLVFDAQRRRFVPKAAAK